MKKKWVGILIAMLLLTGVAACSKGNSNSGGESAQPQPTSSSTNSPASSPTGDAGGEAKKSWGKVTGLYKNHPAFPYKEDWLIWDIYREYAGVDISPKPYPGESYAEAYNLTLASGDLPDLMYMERNSRAHKAGQDGFLLDMNLHMDKMPNLKKWLDENPDVYNHVIDSEGALYYLPTTGAFPKLDSMFLYREDIFKKHNLASPKTYDELLEVMRKLKELYPDSFPLLFSANGSGIMGAMSSQFGTYSGSQSWGYDEATKDWVFGPSTEQYKKMVEFIATAYKEKLIPTDFITLDGPQRTELTSNHKAFIFNTYFQQIDALNADGRVSNPETNWAAMVPPAGDGGGAYNSYGLIAEFGIAVTTKAKNLEGALHLIDWHFTDEGHELTSWGIEGETYQVADGKKQFITATNQNELTQLYGLKSPGTASWYDDTANIALMTDDTRTAYELASQYVATASGQPKFTAEEAEKMALIQTALGKYVDENISKFLIGNRPLSEWDSYVAGLRDIGLEDVHQIYMQAHARSAGN